MVSGVVLAGLASEFSMRKEKSKCFCIGWAGIISLIGAATLFFYDLSKVYPVEDDISKIEKQLHDYEINNYFSKFCEAIYNTKHADELTIMQTTNKDNEEIWEFCNEKLENSPVYKEMKNDQNVKNFDKSISILNTKLYLVSNFRNKLFYSFVGVAVTPGIILLILIFCSWVSTLRRLDRESREKKIADFLVKVNS